MRKWKVKRGWHAEVRDALLALGLSDVEPGEIEKDSVSWAGWCWEPTRTGADSGDRERDVEGRHLVFTWERAGSDGALGILDVSVCIGLREGRDLDRAVDRAVSAWAQLQPLLPDALRPYDSSVAPDAAGPGVRLWPAAIDRLWRPLGVWVSVRSDVLAKPSRAALEAITGFIPALLQASDVVFGAVHGERRPSQRDVWTGFAGEWIARDRLGAEWGPSWHSPYDLGLGGLYIEVKSTLSQVGGTLHLSKREIACANLSPWRLVRVRLPGDAVRRLRAAPLDSAGPPMEPDARTRLSVALGEVIDIDRSRGIRVVLHELARACGPVLLEEIEGPLLAACAAFDGQPALELPFDSSSYRVE